MPEWIIEILKGYGLSGVIICALALALYRLWNDLKETNAARLQERESLIAALKDNTHATLEHAEAIRVRNDVTNKLADNIASQAQAFGNFTAKQDILSEIFRDKQQEQKMAIEALAESNRANTGLLRTIRETVDSIDRKIA